MDIHRLEAVHTAEVQIEAHGVVVEAHTVPQEAPAEVDSHHHLEVPLITGTNMVDLIVTHQEMTTENLTDL